MMESHKEGRKVMDTREDLMGHTLSSRSCTQRSGVPVKPSSLSSGSTAFMARLSTSRGPNCAVSSRRCCSRHATSCVHSRACYCRFAGFPYGLVMSSSTFMAPHP